MQITDFMDLVNFWSQSVKIDVNIGKDLAYALKVQDFPQILFLRGSRIIYRERGETLTLAIGNLNILYLGLQKIVSVK